MRASMYAEAYHNLIQTDLALAEIPDGRGLEACAGCDSCTAVCRNGIRIYDRVRSLAEMGFSPRRIA